MGQDVPVFWTDDTLGMLDIDGCETYWDDYFFAAEPGAESRVLYETPAGRWVGRLDWGGGEYFAELPEVVALRRLLSWGYGIRDPRGGPVASPPAGPIWRGPSIVLGSPRDGPIVLGRPKAPLNRARFQVLRTVFTAYPDSVSKYRFKKPGSLNTYKAMCEDPDYALALNRPGLSNGGGYRLRGLEEVREILLPRVI